jgi:hypothetical protein
MSSFLSLALLLFASPAAGVWVQTFFDDFNGPLNTTSWKVQDNFTHGSSEWEVYEADEVWTADSNLVIRTRARNATWGSRAYNFTSGWVSGNWGQAEGRFEASIKLPYQAKYVWPAFWLLPQTDPFSPSGRCWPTGGEIDILESVGGYKNNRFGCTPAALVKPFHHSQYNPYCVSTPLAAFS